MLQENKINLSIIIPIYNEENFVNKLFDQLKSYFDKNDVEIIVVDDGSTDNSSKLIKNFSKSKNYKFNLSLLTHKKNLGKGMAIRTGIKKSSGEYVILQDADLELDTKDSHEMYTMVQKNKDIKCIFGSRYLSGKLKKNNYFFNIVIGKINSLIFNLFFSQSLSDVHCGLKILHRSVIDKLNLTVNDFGIEIDLASQIVRNKFYIYEFGVSYYFRTKAQGKKITWLDGIKSFYYLIKARFFDNSFSINLSVIYTSIYMTFVGSNFGNGTGKNFSMIAFFIFGSILGLNFKILSSSIILLFIFFGSLFGKGQGKALSIVIFFLIGIFLAKYLKAKIKNSKFKKFF